MIRTRSALLAILALGLTAGGAFAGRDLPAAATAGLDIAAEAAGKTVPVRAGIDAAPAPAVPTTEQEGDADIDHSAHGTAVSDAAQAETPAGWDNHGAWVSSIARQNHGQTTSAEAKASGGRPEGAGKPDTAGPPAGVGRPEGAGKPNG